jgi:hypothetical protein
VLADFVAGISFSTVCLLCLAEQGMCTPSNTSQCCTRFGSRWCGVDALFLHSHLPLCRRNITDTKWREVATHFLAMHNRSVCRLHGQGQTFPAQHSTAEMCMRHRSHKPAAGG